MKKLVLFVCALTTISFAFSQEKPVENKLADSKAYEKGHLMISPGIGLGLYGYNYGGGGIAIPLMVNVDYGFYEHVSLGLYAGYYSKRWDYYYSESFKMSSAHIGARATFHFWNMLDDLIELDLKSGELDIYFTPWIGYNARSVTWDDVNSIYFNDYSNFDNRIHGGAQLGIRKYLNKNIAVFAEWGGTPTSWSNWGITFKF